MDLIKVLLISALSSLLLGQLVRLPLFGQNQAINATDLLVYVLGFWSLVYLAAVKKSLKLSSKLAVPLALFCLGAFLSTVLALNVFTPQIVFVSSLFLIRLVSYILIAIVAANVISKKDILNWTHILLAIGTVFALIGLLQFIFLSDLTFLMEYGWDPHQKRVVSTLLDPNYTGLVLSIFTAISLSLYLYLKKRIYLFLTFFTTLAVILTFSRSSYFALIVIIASIGFIKAPKVILAYLLIFILAFIAIPKMRARVIGALTFDETSKARVESWHNALAIYGKNPILGVGFNTYRYAQEEYGFFDPQNPQGGHSGAGSDSSLLFVAATTGTIGVISYFSLLLSLGLLFAKKAKTSYLSLAAFSSFLGLFVHSQFVNSMFFPQVMLIFWFITGLVLVNDS